MINSFYRNKKNIILIIILTFIFQIILILNGINVYNFNLRKDNIYNQSLGYKESDIMLNDLFDNDELIGEYKRIFYFDSINEETLSKILTNDNFQYNYYAFNNENLNTNEIYLYLDDYGMNNIYIDEYINREIKFKYNNEEYTFIIKNIFRTNMNPFVEVSNEFYNNIIKQENSYKYILKYYYSEKEITEKYKPIRIVFADTEEEIKMSETINKNYKMIYILNIILELFFIIIIFIVNNNVVFSLRNNIKILNYIGYNRSNIIIFKTKILLSMNLIVIFGSFCLMKILSEFLLKTSNIILKNDKQVFVLIIFIIISTIYNILKNNNKF